MYGLAKVAAIPNPFRNAGDALDELLTRPFQNRVDKELMDEDDFLAYAQGKLTERDENVANQFVKRVLSDELGSVEKGEQAFKKSVLPMAYKTYQLGTVNNTLVGALGGGLAGLAGAAAVRKYRDHKEN